jgi:hypothetical protein
MAGTKKTNSSVKKNIALTTVRESFHVVISSESQPRPIQTHKLLTQKKKSLKTKEK